MDRADLVQRNPTLVPELLAAQGLSQEARDPVDVVHRLLAVQAQDPRGARLAIRARSTGLTAADVDRALTIDRSLVVGWLNRGTLHLVRAEDYWWLHALTTPPLATGNHRRLAEEGVPAGDAERAVAAVERALERDGPLTRAQLRERVAATGVRVEGQALVHILFLASVRGDIVRGPLVGHEQAFVAARDWLDAPVAVDRDAALTELTRRYLTGHGPASDRDLARWAGLPLRDVRRGLGGIAGELEQPAGDLVALRTRRRAGEPPPPRLLGAFDPLLLAWSSREPFLGPHRTVVTVNGLFRPFALVRGRAVATWRLADGRVDLAPFAPLGTSDRAALGREADDVERFLGIARRPDRDGEP